MARGADSKNAVIQQILSTFEGSFLTSGGKELRIPMVENGEEVQIKVTLACAKTNLTPDGEAVPKAVTQSSGWGEGISETVTPPPSPQLTEPTEQEKQNVADLLASLGL